jgi:predicted enzyme related to lactoylglutathione lyase
MANPFVHIELDTTDHKKAKEFYGQLLQWELKDMDMGPMGTYTTNARCAVAVDSLHSR